MRNIKKVLKTKTVERLMYDYDKKEEITVTLTYSEVETAPDKPENCVIIKETVIEEKKVTYSMSPATYVKHATVE
jgi:hypothetical protein